MKTYLKIFFICLFLMETILTEVSFGTEVENFEENIRRLGFDRYYSVLKRDKDRRKDPVKVAILDYGFDGFDDERGYTIPKSITLKTRPGDKNIISEKNTHGLSMAQIITQYMTNNYERWSFAPRIYLYKSDGYSNFRWAIEDAIRNEVDIILHSIVIEYGSNYDGRGFFNSLVNHATEAGIIWINAAGNFGLTTYNSEVHLGDNDWIDFDLDKNALPVKCEIPKKAKQDKCNIRLVLSWDDFKNRPLLGTTKDLDLFLFDENFESSISSELTQIDENNSMKNQPGYTLYPREIIETTIEEGYSYIKVRARKDNFASSDQLRVTADGDYLEFPERDRYESLLNPADNPNVITVGENSERSSISKSLNKPELIAPSLVVAADGKRYRGSSNAAAVVAAGIALMKKINPFLDTEAVLDLAKSSNHPSNIRNYPQEQFPLPRQLPPFVPGFVPPELNASFIQSDHYVEDEKPRARRPKSKDDELYYEDYYEEDNYLEGHHKDHERIRRTPDGILVPHNVYSIPTKVLGFAPSQGSGCFALADIKSVEPCVIADFIIKSHSLLVTTTHGLKIATSFDPIELAPYDPKFGRPTKVRQNMNDIIAIFPTEGHPIRIFDRNFPIPPGAVEIFKVPVDELVCKLPDFEFLKTELDLARREIYRANSTGTRNNYILQNCHPYVLTRSKYPSSNWSMYPNLQHTPFVAPVGPGPIEIGASYPSQGNGPVPYGDRAPTQIGEGFQMPNPSELKQEE